MDGVLILLIKPRCSCVSVCGTFVRFIEKSKTYRGISRSGKIFLYQMVVSLSIRHE